METNTNWKNCSNVCLARNYYAIEYDYAGEGYELDPYDKVTHNQTEYDISQEMQLKSIKLKYTLNYDTSYHADSAISWAIQFTTPAGNSKFDQLRYDFTVNTNKLITSDLRYSVASSNANFSKYLYGTVTDANKISSVGSISGDTLVAGSQYSITIGSLNLEPSTTYYLMLYLSTRPTLTSTSYYNDNSLYLSYKNISVCYDPECVYIDNGTEYVKYQCYIEDGTNWNIYKPYIDDGTTWKPL